MAATAKGVTGAAEAGLKALAASVGRLLYPAAMAAWPASVSPVSPVSPVSVSPVSKGLPLPRATVGEPLGEAGVLAVETRALLTQHGLEDLAESHFPAAAIAELPRLPWSVPPAELAARRDLRSSCIFSIDPPTARDLDDALSVTPLPNGGYRAAVHIADVAHFIAPGSALDAEAARRGTSVYLVDGVLPMLPRLLCESLCSLTAGEDRLAFSVGWDLDATGAIVTEWFSKSVIRSCVQLTYGMAQSMLDGTDDGGGGRALHGPHTWGDVATSVRLLGRLAQALRAGREAAGAVRLDNASLAFTLGTDGSPTAVAAYEIRESNRLVEELMLLANRRVAAKIAAAWPDRALLRQHRPPNQRQMDAFLQTCAAHGIPFAAATSGDVAASLASLASRGDPHRLAVVTVLATKPMQLAEYFCTGAADVEDWGHYALAMDRYTHFTSPIRRYADLLVHRQLAAALAAEAAGGGSAAVIAAGAGLPGTRELAAAAAGCNERKMRATLAQDGSRLIYLCALLAARPVVAVAVIKGVGPGPAARFVDCYLPAYGCDVRLELATERGLEATVTSAHAEMRLSWKGGQPVTQSRTQSWTDEPGISRLVLPHVARVFGPLPVVLGASAAAGKPAALTARLYL